jgi:adenosylmethionine-8-amino-7-oxononanoate aminotransferase
MKDCGKLPPVLIKKAYGIRLYDNRGGYYYDTISSWWCNVHGHNHPKIKRAIKRQLDSLEHILFAGFTHEPAIRLSEELVRIAPKVLTKVFYSDDGSTAVETALKMSYQYWQNIGRKRKRRFVSLDHGYHGDTIGAMSISGVDLFNEVFSPLFFDSYKVASPYCYRCPMGKERPRCHIECLRPMEEVLRKRGGEIAAIILEPLIMAAGGMIVYPVEYLEGVGRLAKKYGAHLILDEVATGFGRTGKMFACEHGKIRPDFICLSKGITSGYLPLGATLTTERVYDAFCGGNRTFYHGHTYTANPVSCAAALASLEVFREEGVLARIKKLIPFFHKRMEGFRPLDIVGDVRYIGMIGAIELVRDKKAKKPFGPEREIGKEIYKRGLKEHIILRPLGDIIYLWLPLCIRENEMETVLGGTYEVIRSIKA